MYQTWFCSGKTTSTRCPIRRSLLISIPELGVSHFSRINLFLVGVSRDLYAIKIKQPIKEELRQWISYDIFHDKIKTFQKTTLFGKRLTQGIYGEIHRLLLTDYCINRFLPYLFLSEDIAHKALPRPSQSYSNTRREKQMATGSHRCRSQCRGGTALCACLNRETNVSSEPLFLLMCWVS